MTRILLIFLGILLFFLMVMVIDCNRFVVKNYTITSDKLKKDGTFMLLSDLHNKSFGSGNKRLLKAIRKSNPDVILIAGDMYTATKGKDNSKTADFVSELSKNYHVYYGNGNHEHKTRIYPDEFGHLYEGFMDKIQKAGATVLINENTAISDYNIQVYGLEIDRFFYKKFTLPKLGAPYISYRLGDPEKEKFNILIAHNPDYFKDYAKWGADLVVSGHVHGGLMRLPVLGGVISPRLVLFPRYDGGRFTSGKCTMILGRGLGTHTLPVRIFNPGELVVLHMKKG